jgi:hypothetical protein
LTYLSFDAFGSGACSHPDNWQDEVRAFDARVQKYSLFLYAARNWSTHVCQASLVLKGVYSIAMKFLGNEGKVASALQTFDPYDSNPSDLVGAPDIHLVVMMQCEEFTTSWQACGGDVIAKDREGRTALLRSINIRSLKIMRCLLDSGADLNGDNYRNRAALMLAALYGWVEGIKLLLERGADPNAEDVDHWTALHFVAQADHNPDAFHESCAGLLLKAGADIGARNCDGDTPLIAAPLLLSYSGISHPAQLRLSLCSGCTATAPAAHRHCSRCSPPCSPSVPVLLRGLSLASHILSLASEPLLLLANHALPAAAVPSNFLSILGEGLVAQFWDLSEYWGFKSEL